MTGRLTRWWSRPCGGRDVVRLAAPLVVSTVSWTVMNFIDRMFLLWYDDQAMAAAMAAAIAHFTLLCLPLGIASYVNTFVAQYYGAGQPRRIGLAVWQAVWIGVIATPVFVATIPLAPYAFEWFGHAPELVALEITYYQIITLGAGAMVIASGFSSYFTGRGQTKTVMVVDVAAALLNVLLDYLWIFGYGGFPEMGLAGAAWATVASLWFKAFAYWWLMESHRQRDEYGVREGRRYDRALFGRLLRFGLPNGVQLSVEMLPVSLFVLLIGRLGENELVATTLAFNVNSVAFVPLLGLGIAVTTIVGQQLGRDQPDLAARATWTSLSMAMLYMGTMAVLYVAAPDLFLLGHAAGSDAVEFAAARELTIVLLRFVAAYCLFDALNIIFVCAIKGAGDTRFILYTTLVVSSIPVALAWIGMSLYGQGLIWCWWMLTLWVCALGIVYFARFLQGRWRTMRVIEPEPVSDESMAELAVATSGDRSE